MKGSHWFVVFILAFLVVMFAVEYHLPKQFVWNPTFSHSDHQPFGCAVFDSLLSTSIPSGYTVSKKSLYQLEKEDTVGSRAILIVAKDLNLSKVDVESMLKMAGRGSKFLLVSSSFGSALEDTLGVHCVYSRLSVEKLKQSAISFNKDTFYWVGNAGVYPQQSYRVYPQFCEAYFKDCDSLFMRRLARRDTSSLLALALPHEKGEIILASTPLLFTNYGVLDGHNTTYVFRLLSQMKGLPFVRTEAYMKETAQENRSPFRYILSQPPLCWALYLTVVAIILFMIFTARRRQRAIPVVREPENGSLEFTELIGTLYHQKKDYADLVRKKFTYFAEELRREIQVDLEESDNDERSCQRIVQKTGMDGDDIRAFVRNIRSIVDGERNVSDEEMKRLIDKMNEIINHI